MTLIASPHVGEKQTNESKEIKTPNNPKSLFGTNFHSFTEATEWTQKETDSGAE